ncbi:MAG: RNase adapter RapZ [Pseudomonadota bacterium]
MPRIVLVTGMAGAGRTTALHALEDVGFEAIDNPPVDLLDGLLRPDDQTARDRAVGVDCRAHAFDSEGFNRQLDELLRDTVTHLQLLFLDCEEEILRRRFTETRRRHPLAKDRRVTDGIAEERILMAPLRERADLVIDTSQLSPGDLRRIVVGNFAETPGDRLTVSVMSFAYRNGLPREADLVFDVRFLKNPHYDEELRPLTGKDPRVCAYVQADPNYKVLVTGLGNLLIPLLPSYQSEGKSYLTIAFGCTGGRHRSIAVAEAIGAALRTAGWPVLLHHRDTPDANNAEAGDPAPKRDRRPQSKPSGRQDT